MKGRKPKPPELRIIEGNRGHRPIPETPKTKPAHPPTPHWLSAAAKKEWRKIVPELYQIGLLKIVDVKGMEAYCTCYAKWREVSEKTKIGVMTAASGYVYANPLINVELKYAKEMRGWMAELGLTPASRSRILYEEPESEDEDLD